MMQASPQWHLHATGESAGIFRIHPLLSHKQLKKKA